MQVLIRLHHTHNTHIIFFSGLQGKTLIEKAQADALVDLSQEMVDTIFSYYFKLNGKSPEMLVGVHKLKETKRIK